ACAKKSESLPTSEADTGSIDDAIIGQSDSGAEATGIPDKVGVGLVTVTQGPDVASLNADFRSFPSTTASNVCTVDTHGLCEVVHGDLSKETPPQVFESAGAVTVTKASDTPVTLSPVDGRYATVNRPSPFFVAGDTLTLAAVGAAVPSFSGIT